MERTKLNSSGTEVLIIGGAGFIGSHIADSLVDNANVTVYDNLSTGRSENLHPDVSLLNDTIRNPERLTGAVEQADLVFHLAAQVSVQRSIEGPIFSHETNLDPILTILEAARGSDTRVVFASSAAIYGEPEYTPIDEDHPKEPNSPYGLEKLTADQYCRLYHDLYDVEAVALRYFNVYGPRQQAGDYSGVISIFREQARAGDPITVEGDGAQTRDFVHVDDVVQANLLAATAEDAPGNGINVGTGTEITIRELAEAVRQATNSDSEIVHVEPREGDIKESVADISLARKELGYEPKYEIYDGIEAYLGE
ncbi:NAD-dependent epimerase/dehydratase family protein [Halorubrum sp. Eb13]|uniref:NAD-dependent epimerase/dehydratase family protein n=1 Tax=Halorubrum sp. Eb13 TaxID=1383843 RepID=UPI000B998400|nr:NAD-dependent epimerase/dehydratase family protein [Halorubrum sp. Eb13]OYR41437.1 nucleoside-diphosphate sugar epimerase [Halorubrum sp. Eb13]